MVHQKNYGYAVGIKKDKSKSVASGRHNELIYGHSEEKTTRVSGTCFDGVTQTETVSWDDSGTESTRKAKDEIHGWIQGDGGREWHSSNASVVRLGTVER